MSDNRTTAEIIKSHREAHGGSELDSFRSKMNDRDFAEAYDREDKETAELRRRAQERMSY